MRGLPAAVLRGEAVTTARGLRLLSVLRDPFCPRPGIQKRLGDKASASCRMLISSKNFAENFAELRAERAPICPLGSTLLR
jgi:hypothetical protein